MKKKVAFIIQSLYGGGAERVVSVLSNALVENGVSVSLILYQRKEKEYLLDPRVQIEELPPQVGKNPFAKHMGYIHEIGKVLEKIQPDVVVPFLAIPVVHTFYATRGKSYKVLATVRNNPRQYPAQRWLRTLSNYCTKNADGIIYQTEEQIQYFKGINNYFVLHNPVNPEMLNQSYVYKKEIDCIATFGRLSAQKNHQLLVKAFSKIAEEFPKISLRIYGDGEEKKALQLLINNLKLEDRVHLMGNTKNVKEKLSETDIFVLSSDYEGLPNALLEAMAVGVPCIATECPTGPKDLIDNEKNGLLIPCNDLEKMEAALRRLILSYTLREKLGVAGKKRILDEYTIDNIINKFVIEILN